MKVLIAEDDPVARTVLVKILAADTELRTSVVADGEAAWAMLDDPGRSFDVIFLDLNLPKLDGFELLQRIRQSPLLRSLEIILCTCANDRATVLRAAHMGVRHYLVKPCRAELVHAKLRNLRSLETLTSEQRLAGY